MSYKLFLLKNIPTANFTMTALELAEYISFPVKRVYFLTDGVGEQRTGSHCHRAEEDELFVCIKGSATAVVDDGHGLTELKLEGPKHALYIPHLVWHHFKNLSDDLVICALSSTSYDPTRADYCEDYLEFKKLVPRV